MKRYARIALELFGVTLVALATLGLAALFALQGIEDGTHGEHVIWVIAVSDWLHLCLGIVIIACLHRKKVIVLEFVGYVIAPRIIMWWCEQLQFDIDIALFLLALLAFVACGRIRWCMLHNT